jgi:hypothetical protein
MKGNCMEKFNNFPSSYNDFIEKGLMTGSNKQKREKED